MKIATVAHPFVTLARASLVFERRFPDRASEHAVKILARVEPRQLGDSIDAKRSTEEHLLARSIRARATYFSKVIFSRCLNKREK